MKQLTGKLVLPLTLISFVCITKWWYVKVDAPDTVLYGFPLPYRCAGWHTSMSTQFFMAEMVFDLLVYFLFWFVLVYAIHRFLFRLMLPKIVVTALWLITGFTLFILVLMAVFMPDDLYYTTRHFDYELVDTGVHFIWDNHHPEER